MEEVVEKVIIKKKREENKNVWLTNLKVHPQNRIHTFAWKDLTNKDAANTVRFNVNSETNTGNSTTPNRTPIRSSIKQRMNDSGNSNLNDDGIENIVKKDGTNLFASSTKKTINMEISRNGGPKISPFSKSTAVSELFDKHGSPRREIGCFVKDTGNGVHELSSLVTKHNVIEEATSTNGEITSLNRELKESIVLNGEVKTVVNIARSVHASPVRRMGVQKLDHAVVRNTLDDDVIQIGKTGKRRIQYMPTGERLYMLGEARTTYAAPSDYQDFQEIRSRCLADGRLFEDPEFPANDRSLYYNERSDRPFTWLRPSEICQDPALFVEGYSRFDVRQGELGDCWLLAAVANLTLYRKLFFQVVPDDQSFDEQYAGVFHFRFWQYGRWVDVVIDDRLPTYHGKLVFLHSTEKNEFWSALLEKAYAKLHGSYEALKGGSTCEAMEDFTGGVTEKYEMEETPPNLYTILLKAYERSSMMGCSLEADPHILEAETPQGLIRGHAYSITRVKYVDIETPGRAGKIPLLRLRNPWGNEAEWNGAWSDKSPEWRYISDAEKEELGLNFDDDGEFWMSYKDFTTYFTRVEICNLNPDSLDPEECPEGCKKKWEMSVFEGEWVRGVTAGGCRNFLDTFSRNPQYSITLIDVDEDDEENKCTVIVALMQKNRRSQQHQGLESLSIGFTIYHLPEYGRVPKPLDLNFFKYNESIANSNAFINLREVSSRFKLPPGTYCIVPSSFDPDEEGEFLLRVFSEKCNNMAENDEDVGMGTVDDRVKDIVSPNPEPEDPVRQFFQRLAGEDGEVDWQELKEILDYAMQEEMAMRNIGGGGGGVGAYDTGGAPPTRSFLEQLLCALCICKEFGVNLEQDAMRQAQESVHLTQPQELQGQGFSKDVCRSMVAMLDKDGSGKLGFEEFKSLWIDLRQWRAVFRLYDTESRGAIRAESLRDALHSAGYTLNAHVLNVLAHRYGSRDGYIQFDDFIMCAVRLKTMIANNEPMENLERDMQWNP